MDIGALVAVITVLLAVVSWLLARNHTLNQLTVTQRETIDELRRNVDRMEIVAELTEKLMAAIPQQRTPESTQ